MCHLSDEAAAALDAAIERGAEAHVRLLEELVRVPSVVGQESRAIDLLADRLEALGFDIRAVPLADALAEAPGGGRPLVPAAGRCALVGERAGAGPRSLLLNGHVDVVPPGDDALWALPPFSPAIRDGWLFGRGAGDMKGGIAMALLALAALVEAAPAALDGRVVAAFVPEEECTGNGTLATILAGATADVALLPEPTDLGVLVSGVGVSWVELEVRGEPAHAGSATDGVNPVDRLLVLVAALRDLGAAFEAEHPEAIARGERFHVNLGLVRAGEWTSSVPSSARGSVRIGYPAALAPADLERRVADAIARAAAADPWLARVPPHVRFVGLRAEPHALAVDHPLVEAVREAHRAAHGALPPVVHGAATSDARLYLNQAAMPALCYGPRARAIHGVDEAVELASIVDGARTLARAIAALLGTAP